MIRVLHVFGLTDRGGAETMIMNYYRNIDRNEIQFDFVNHTTKECAYDQEIRSMGGRIFHIPKYKGYNHFQYQKAWKYLFKAHPEYKIIHIHYFSLAGAIVGVAKKCGVKVRITHVHSVGTNTSKVNPRHIMCQILKPFMLKNSTHFFACGELAGRDYFGNSKKYEIIPISINSTNFTPNPKVGCELRQQLDIPLDALVIGHVGRFIHVKNHLFLIDIFKALKRRHANSYLILIGSGALLEEVKKKTVLLGLSDSVRFIGIQSNINEWLQTFDVFVMPSILEGFPVSVIEAQAAGLPCVISDTIDHTVNITKNISFVNLNATPEYWANVIITSLKECNKEAFIEISKSKYDVKQSTSLLTEFYYTSIHK